ncbi:Werner syndrome ATP-dependent helicase [Hypsizygus marmoreus]|uniref:3'-5' exonuclease n=1 Tax=Hypsizygus marmoreus TaxID=39966 RepID=A0A369JWV5_HYPMA|nr:Werner syndrome ATP-dependent helicase [Hypsizygus marmoreus]
MSKSTSKHGGSRVGAGRKSKLSQIQQNLFSSNSVAGTSKTGHASPFFAKRPNTDQMMDSNPAPAEESAEEVMGIGPLEESDPNVLTADEYTRLQSEWNDAQELETNEGRGDAEVEESLLENENDDDLLNAMRQAEQESEEGDKSQGIHDDYLRGVRDKLKAQIASSGQPTCYKNGTFWIHPKDPLFALNATRNSPSGYSPTELYYLPIFVWLPEFLPGRPDYLRCAKCSGHLTRDGWNSNPIARRVRDMHNDYFLITGRLNCNKERRESPGCGASYQGTSPEILAQLRRDVQESFPAYLTARGAVDKSLMAVMRTLFASRFGPEPFASLLGEMRHLHHAHRELMYLSACASSPNQPSPASFSTFEDKARYAGTHPSTQYCKSVFVDWMRAHRVFLDRIMASLPGEILKGDHTFKLLKYMLRLMGEPTHDAMYTVVNEWEDARNQAFTLTKSLSYVSEMYEDIADGLEAHGHAPTSFMYTDNASGELAFHEFTTRSLTNNVVHREIDPHSTLPALAISPDFRVVVYDSSDLIDSACLNILEGIPEDSSWMVIGFDIEYQVETTGQGGPGAQPRARTGQLDVIQIATQDTIYVFKVTQFRTPASVPPCLRAVLMSNQIIKAGRAVRADLQRIAEAWSISELSALLRTSDACSIELGTMAKLKGKVSDASTGLAALSAIVLQKRLSKPDSIQCSQWSISKLTDAQKDYAALDAYASWCIWRKLSSLPSVGLHVTDIVPGQLISFYSGKKLVALGSLISPSTTVHIPSIGSANARSINVTRSRAIILVEKVVVPGFIVLLYHETLETLSAHLDPFHLVVACSSLRTRASNPPVPSEDNIPNARFILEEPGLLQSGQEISELLSEVESDSDSESDMDSSDWDEEGILGFQTLELDPSIIISHEQGVRVFHSSTY